jgi:hypothetical protein
MSFSRLTFGCLAAVCLSLSLFVAISPLRADDTPIEQPAATSAAVDEDGLPIPDAKAVGEINELIGQLGDESYAVRESATERILEYGLAALKLVQEGAKNPDREVRYRCERLQVVLRDMDLQRRLEAFAADLKGERDHGLPAWNRYSEQHGSGAGARQLFVDIFRAEPEVLKMLQNEPGKVGDMAAGRVFELQQLLQAQQPVSLGSVAALLFAAGDKEIQMSDQTQQYIFNFCYQQSVRDAVSSGEKKEAVRSLLGKFIERSEGFVAYQGMNVAMQYDLKEGLGIARKLIDTRGGGQPHMLQMAFLAVAKMGSSDDVKDVTALLDDKTVIMNFQINNQKIECQVRDFALVTTLHLLSTHEKGRLKGTPLESGDLKAFGFDRLEGNAIQVFQPHTIGFTSSEKRDEVFKAWEEVKAKLPKEMVAEPPTEDTKGAEAKPEEAIIGGAVEAAPALRALPAIELKKEGR